MLPKPDAAPAPVLRCFAELAYWQFPVGNLGEPFLQGSPMLLNIIWPNEIMFLKEINLHKPDNFDLSRELSLIVEGE